MKKFLKSDGQQCQKKIKKKSRKKNKKQFSLNEHKKDNDI